MKSLQFPETFVKLISVLEDNFSKASFRRFKVLLTAILLGHPKKTVTAGMRLLELGGHFSNPCRFMSHYVWDASRLGLSVLTLLLRHFPTDGPLLFALDDTLVGKYGPKIFGRGLHFNHGGKPNESRYINGHNWVVLGRLYFS